MQRSNKIAVAASLTIAGIGITLNLDSDKHPGSELDVARMDRAQTPTQPRFDMAWLRGELQLSGHTLSTRHEQNLLKLAATSFPDRPIKASFEPLGIVPRHWEDTTLQVLYALAPAVSARASLVSDRVEIQAVADNDLAWRNRFNALQTTLPDGVSLSQDTIAVAESFDAASLCGQAFQNFTAGPISFEESSAVFRSSAFPRLDRVIAIADACRHATITITGHTDASGSVLGNHKLSLERAQAVADYMADVGIDRARMRVNGAGSSQPIADNNTRYGRGLNRRIEIGFTAY